MPSTPLRAEAGQRFREQAGRERQYAFEPFKLAFRGAVIVRTVIKAGVHGPENASESGSEGDLQCV